MPAEEDVRAFPAKGSFCLGHQMKRTVIFANGHLPDPAAVQALLQPDDWIIAADGGACHALACGRTPHLVIGDLDSLPPETQAELEAAGSKCLAHPADKDETDLELALLHASAAGAATVLVLGAFGGRLDQTLANLLLLARPELAHLHISITDGRQTAYLVRDEIAMGGTPGDRVSLIPIGGDVHGVTTRGLAWRLAGETLYLGQTRGVSNVMTSPPARVQVTAGLLLCVHERMGESPA
jgi:thiamine pyrophosphokinase